MTIAVDLGRKATKQTNKLFGFLFLQDFVYICEIISTVILLPSAESFKKGFCQLQAKVCARSTG